MCGYLCMNTCINIYIYVCIYKRIHEYTYIRKPLRLQLASAAAIRSRVSTPISSWGGRERE